ncbi:hypothetical protein [Albirhodobacter sp. R86504]|uniref:hypothetical protein n=1 Tax=Albirhodobacter sp. R86504 TaxID=3093848 RepID=UPI00366FC6EF
MTKVFQWPPVCPRERSLRISAPISSERSLLTGRRYASSRGRARYVAALSVNSHSHGKTAAGYMEALERLLDGGLHLIRLSLWSNAVPRKQRWLPGGVLAVAVASGDLQSFTLTGIPPRYELLRPDEPFTVGGVVYRAVNRVIGAEDRTATVFVAGDVGAGGALTIGGAESRVFAVDSFPSPSQAVSSAWSYDWAMTEVFADEVQGGFEEINPWG